MGDCAAVPQLVQQLSVVGTWLELLDLDRGLTRSQTNLIVRSPRLPRFDAPELDVALMAEALENDL